MILPEIEYHAPRTLAEALKLLVKLKEARIMAGGTDLLVELKQGLVEAEALISLQNIKELKKIEKKDQSLRLGAMVTPQEIISHPLIKQHFPALVEAAKSMASPQVRSLATIGGNIASAVPSADLPPTLIAAEASLELQCTESFREVNLLEFFTGPRLTICRDEELLISILIPVPPPKTGISFLKFSLREANALAVASVASRITLENEVISQASVVLGAVAPSPLLALKASELLEGKKPSPSLFEKAASIAKDEASPISDIRSSIWYRKELIQVLTRRSLAESLKRAQKNPG
ncbi:MAG: xanthine dehydrogenase family protein subunit M [Candidatus Aminicenantes bacterium]|nr:xanthine dehydrogenase family protein subunit M [Candidatus Aminicenantes bacterium]